MTDSLNIPSSNSLPFDILEVIIEKVAEERDIGTLKALSLVRRDFLDICQPHSFSTIDLHPRFVNALTEILERNGRLPLYVEKLILTIHPGISNETQLPWVLEQLHNIKCLHLSMEPGANWSQFSHRLQSALKMISQSPKLNELELENVCPRETAIALVVRAPNLRHLALYEGQFVPPQTLSGKFFKVPQPETLDVGGGGIEMVQGLIDAKRSNGDSAIDFSQLRKIEMDVEARYGGYPYRMFIAFELFSRLLCLEELKIMACRESNNLASKSTST